MVTNTSIESYQKLAKSLGERQREVFFALFYEGRPLSNHEISRKLNREINCITGRVNELREKGLVEFAGDEFDFSTGRAVKTWKVVKVNEELAISERSF